MGKSKGEVSEIKESLASLARGGIKNSQAKTDVFKKVINYMTVGIDMSSLFMQVMTSAVSSSEDIALKKMLYLYICTYAQQNPELTLLTINLLTKDCQDQDPTIRGLALRSLCSLRVQNLIEYLVQPIRMGLKDPHHYVRRTAVMGVLKVYHLDKATVKNAGFLDDLREMLTSDPDAQVVANCLSVLQQAGEAQKLVTRTLVISLLNRIKEFSEWAQCQVLEFASQYQPADEQEVYGIMNVLDDRLSHSNSAVVMGCVKLFLHLTLRLPATHQQVLERIKDPMQTMISRDRFETAYAVLTNFLLIVQRAPVIFSQIYTSFYCRQNEPSYMKTIKLEILAAIADETNAFEIATELTEYVNDIDVPLGRAAVRAVGKIALEVQDTAGIVERLLGFLEVGKSHVTAEALIQIKDLLRRYPDIADACISSISATSVEDVHEPEAKAAFVWILGQYGQQIQDAPYLLEPIAQNFAAEDPQVRLATLLATGKLFLKRPPECQLMFGQTLAAAAQDPNQSIHDRALLYYRLLRQGIDEAKKVISPQLPVVVAFAEDQSAEMRDRIFDEFNSLAVVYQQPSYAFVQQATASDIQENLAGLDAASGQVLADEGDSLLPDDTSEDLLQEAASSPATNGVKPPLPSGSGSANHTDLLDAGDLLGGFEELSVSSNAVTSPPPASLQLQPSPTLSPADFQSKWASWQPLLQREFRVSPTVLSLLQPPKLQVFTQKFQAQNLATMASGGQPPNFRFYFHGQALASSRRFLVELIVVTTSSKASATVKSESPSQSDTSAFASLLESILTS